MKIAFCSLPLKTGHKTRGIGAYTRNLLVALRKQAGVQIQEFGDLSEVKDADVVHYPFFDLFQNTLPFSKKFPTVVTIHDVIPLAYPKFYPPGLRGSLNNFLQKIALRGVSAVITDSGASKKDIVKLLKVPGEKVYSIQLAPAGHFCQIKDQKILQEIKTKYQLPGQFVLYTGNVNWNKNLLNLTEGVINAGVDLVLVGKSFEERENINHPELYSFKQFLDRYSDHPKVHILGFVEDEDLVGITNLASVVCLPSFAEGFGLTILEAQFCGVPVITSNISSMPEVAGEGALLINPYSVEEIAGAIKRVIEDKRLREELVKKGLDNVSRFSWNITAAETVKVYEYATSKRDT